MDVSTFPPNEMELTKSNILTSRADFADLSFDEAGSGRTTVAKQKERLFEESPFVSREQRDGVMDTNAIKSAAPKETETDARLHEKCDDAFFPQPTGSTSPGKIIVAMPSMTISSSSLTT
jgi:hypothetical protein